MAFYVDEEEVWKCPQHPSKRRRSGICPVCLKERLASLCPDCANARPCTCSATSSASSSSSSGSFSRLSGSGIGAIGRVSNLIDSEPAFRRSRSLAIPFLRSKPENSSEKNDFAVSNKTSSFWSKFRAGSKSKRCDVGEVRDEEKKERIAEEEEDRKRMMRKSRSVAVTSVSGIRDVKSSSAAKGKGWSFPSPIKAFRQSRVSKMVFHERSPLYRG